MPEKMNWCMRYCQQTRNHNNYVVCQSGDPEEKHFLNMTEEEVVIAAANYIFEIQSRAKEFGYYTGEGYHIHSIDILREKEETQAGMRAWDAEKIFSEKYFKWLEKYDEKQKIAKEEARLKKEKQLYEELKAKFE